MTSLILLRRKSSSCAGATISADRSLEPIHPGAVPANSTWPNSTGRWPRSPARSASAATALSIVNEKAPVTRKWRCGLASRAATARACGQHAGGLRSVARRAQGRRLQHSDAGSRDAASARLDGTALRRQAPAMSRAFVKEDAGGDEGSPDRPVSTTATTSRPRA